MILGIGSAAHDFAARVEQGDIDAIVTDLPNLRTAYPLAVQRRHNGEQCYGMVLWDEPREQLARQAAAELLAQFQTLDERNGAFRALAAGQVTVGGRHLSEPIALEPSLVSTAGEFMSMVPGQLFRSTAEAERFATTFRRRRSDWSVLVAPVRLPDVSWSPTRTPRVVIWAPDLDAPQTALLAFALEELHAETWVICKESSPQNVRAEFMPIGNRQVPDLVASASCIVDASLSDPGAAIAFAVRGFPVAVSSTSGAAEFVGRAPIYNPIDFRSVYVAVLKAIGRPACVRRELPLRAPPLQISRIDWSARQCPLVSIVVPSYNRPLEARSQLRSLSRQTYPNVQIVLVNDGGVKLQPVCDEFPALDIKLLDRSENVGAVAAINAGIFAADGLYVAVTADDDPYFPDHIERLVEALESSGGSAAHANTLVCLAEAADDGKLYESAYNASVMHQALDPTEVLWTPWISAMSMLVRRDLYLRYGGWDEHTDMADYEIYLRLSRHADILHVDHFTCACHARVDGKGIGSKLGGQAGRDAFAYAYRRHPVPDRPIIEQRRAALLQVVENRPIGQEYAEPPTFRFSADEAASRPLRQ